MIRIVSTLTLLTFAANPVQAYQSNGPILGEPLTLREQISASEFGWRPAGPIRVALQAGHWRAWEAPAEQSHLRRNGSHAAGIAEWEVNLGIARRAARLLEAAGYAVDILPTTIPPGYHADVFISIHADANSNRSLSGFRAAAPRRDRTGRARRLVGLLTYAYGVATGLPHYPHVTGRMTGYYAFNSRRYRHALHPMTVGVILETGFLTNASDRRIIVHAQDRAARGIADAVVQFLGPPGPLGSAIGDRPLGRPMGHSRQN